MPIVAQRRPRAELWANIPAGLRERPQWCIAGPDKSPRTATGQLASVTNPATWTDFDTACAAAYRIGSQPGFVITKDGPYACIDLDVKDATNEPDRTKHTTPEQIARFASITESFDSYSERSRSGIGLHIWVRGSIGQGCRRDGVEVYSQARFIVCTGDVYIDKAMGERQALLVALVAEINRGQETTPCELIELPPVESDEAVYWKARSLSTKFDALWQGDWRAMRYPSQSEADFALMGLLAHATTSNEQCRRLFRWSGLGRTLGRKAKPDDYLNRTLGRHRATLAWVAQVQAGWLR